MYEKGRVPASESDAGTRPFSRAPCVSPALRRALAAEVDELEVGLVKVLEQRHGGLKVVAGLGGDAEFVALDLRLDGFGGFVADQLVDLLGEVLRDAFLDGGLQPEFLAGCERLAGVQGLERDAAAD